MPENFSEIQLTDGDKLDYSTEIAYNSFVKDVIRGGLIPPGAVTIHLMYLPNQKVTQQFKDACKAVLDCLKGAFPPEKIKKL